jgi:hypothetical protein
MDVVWSPSLSGGMNFSQQRQQNREVEMADFNKSDLRLADIRQGRIP